MAVANGAKRDVMGHDEPDRRFNLVDRCAKDRAIHSRGRDCTVHHVIDFVILEREYLG